MTRVSVTDLSKNFDSGDERTGAIVTAVDHVSFEIDNKVLSLVGPSGCGKTTILRIIAGLETPDHGRVQIGEKTVCDSRTFVPAEKRNVGLVFQSFALWPHMKIFDNIAMPLKIRKATRLEIERRIKEVTKFLGLEALLDRYPSQISGGQQQRVALARALIHEPDVILLDEPLSNLDAKIRDSARAELKRIFTRLETTVIYVTHDQLEAITISDEMGVMNAGKVLEFGTARQLYERPKHKFTAEFLGKVNMIEGHVDEGTQLISTKIGDFKAEIPEDVKSADVLVAFRPSRMEFVNNHGEAKENTFTGVVEEVNFLGEFYEVVINAKGQKLKATLLPTSSAKAGDEVNLRVRRENIIVSAQT